MTAGDKFIPRLRISKFAALGAAGDIGRVRCFDGSLYFDDGSEWIKLSGLAFATASGTSITLDATHNGKQVRTTNAAAKAVTIPPTATLGANFIAQVINIGAGDLTFVEGSGVTFRNEPSAITQWHTATIIAIGTDEYVIVYDEVGGAGVSDGDKGDITVSTGGTAWAINANAVTYAKMQNISAASKLLGRQAGSAGAVQEITLGTNLSMSGSTLNATGGGGGADFTPVTLADAATVAIDADDGLHFVLDTAASRTLGAPGTGQYDGQTILVRWTNTGGSPITTTLTTGSAGAFRFLGGATALGPTAAASSDYIVAVYQSTDDRWDVIGYSGEFRRIVGYEINVQALTSSPADAATAYFGVLPKAPVTTGGQSKVYVRNACTIKRAEIYCYSGTAGSNQAWSLYVRANNTTDTLIQTLSVATSERIFSNTSLSVALAAGEYFEIKMINPTWTTNPLTTIFGGRIYVEEG